jgi:anti-sigma factor ChrR (cupin superfamily)
VSQRTWYRLRRGLSCHQVMEVLQAYLDGEVDVRVARNVARHLDRCQRCRTESALYVDIRRRLSQQPDGMDPEVLGRLRDFARTLLDDGRHVHEGQRETGPGR